MSVREEILSMLASQNGLTVQDMAYVSERTPAVIKRTLSSGLAEEFGIKVIDGKYTLPTITKPPVAFDPITGELNA